MLKRLRGYFLKNYVDQSTNTKKQAFSLVIVLLTLLLLSILMTIIIGIAFVKAVLAGIAGIIVLFLALTRAGKAGFVSIAVSILLAVSFSAIMAFRVYGHPYEMYFLSFIIAFDVGMTSFISRRPWLPALVMGIGSVGVLYLYFARILPAKLAILASDLNADDLVICFVVGWTNVFISMAVMRRSQSLLSAAESEAEMNLKRFLSMQEALSASSESLTVGSKLTESSRRSSVLAENTLDQISSAAGSMDALSSGTGVLRATLEEILESSRAASRSAEDQSGVVTETSAAIEEMTASIKNISRTTESRRDSVRRLDESTAQGREEMKASSEAVQQMEAQAASILEVVKVISAVASQTDLLSMNAAIEAAHAGEYGRGFSVVADEIRKLSEQTGKNVKAISATMKKTIAAIDGVARGNERTMERYARIADDATLLSQAMEEVINGLAEIASGTEEIMAGVQASVQSTYVLKTATVKVDEEIQSAEKALEALDTASQRILGDITAIKRHSEEVREEARRIMEIGIANEEGLKHLKSMLGTA